jgi:polyisoprenoid-binding protein YceI
MSITAHTDNNPGIAPGVWTIDPSHSTVGFVVRHLMVAKVRGRFGAFTGTVTIADNVLDSRLEASVEMTSVDTGDAGRDSHIRGGDFFDVDTFPAMTFVSTSLEAAGGDYALHGNLTIKGVAKPVTFAFAFYGIATDPWGNTKAGFSATAEINRKDWGIEWNAALEAGGVLVGEKVKIQLDIEAAKV